MTETRYESGQVPSSRPPEPPYRFDGDQQAQQATQQVTQQASEQVAQQPTQQVTQRVEQPTQQVTQQLGDQAQQPMRQPQGSVPDTSGVDVVADISETRQFDRIDSTYGYNDGRTETMPRTAAPEPAQQAPRSHRASNTARPAGGGAKTFLYGFLGALVACALFFGIGGVGFGLFKGNATGGSTASLGASNSSVISAESEDATLAETVAAKALPSVVYIGVYSDTSQQYGMYYGQSSQDTQLTQSALGSGIILTEDGYILTNYHVVEGAAALKVTAEGVEYDAEVVGTDPSSDIAVIKAKDASGLKAADIGDSDDLAIGEWVMSVGCPFGLEQSVATGVVSATSRSRVVENTTTDYFGMSYATGEPTLYPNMIQTDAAINPGNSGGALVDSDGKVIGVNTLIASYSGNYSGVGFAIPINYASHIANQIINGETPTHAKLGVSITNVTSSVAKRYNLASDYGAYVTEVAADSGADAAGVQKGDIIIAMDSQKIETATDLTLAIRGHNPGDTVTITVNRNGDKQDLQVVLGSDESQLAAASNTQQYGNGYGNGGNGYGYGYGDNGNGGNGGNGNGYGGNGGQGYSYEDMLRYFGLL